MSLYGALYSGVSGLKTQSNKIGVISDNISNVNTIGYKAGQAQFETLVTNSGIKTAYSPGGAISQNRQLVDKQGLLQTTENSTDIALSGKGFFVVHDRLTDDAQDLYTRAGSFRQDNLGNFRNASGFYLMGWPLDREGRLPGEPGNLNTVSSANLDSLQVVNVQSVSGVAAATTTVGIGANLDASQTVYPGDGETADMDPLSTANYAITGKSIIVPTAVNSISRGDKFNITTGTGLNYTYRYGGYTLGRDVTSATVGDGNTSLIASPLALPNNPFTTGAATSTTVTVNTGVAHGLQNGAVVTLSGVAAAVDGIPASDFNQSFVISNVTATGFDITVATGAALGAVVGGGATVSSINRPFIGNILDASTATGLFLGTTGTSPFRTEALSFTITTTTVGTTTFTYTSSTPNAQLGQFNTLTNLASAINSVEGLTARVDNGRLYVGAVDANDAITFANGETQGLSGPPVLSGIDWIQELDLANQAAGSDRFNSLEGLYNLVNNNNGLSATLNNSLGAATVDINVDDPLDTITFSDPTPSTSAADAAATYTTTNGSSVVTVTTSTTHGLQTGDKIVLNNVGGGPYNGITAAQLAGTFIVTVTGPTTFTIQAAAAATASGVSVVAAGLTITSNANSGSLLGELGITASLNSALYTPQTTGALGPAYDATDSAKNMSSGEITAQFSRNIRVFDSQGSGHDLRVSFIKTGLNTWAAEVHTIPPADIGTATGQVAYGTITFNGDGSLRSVSSGLTNAISINWVNGASASEITFDWGTAGQPFGTTGATVFGKTDGLSQFDANYNIAFVEQNGAQVGELIGVNITEEGFVVASYNNGENQSLFKIPVADFSDPNNLKNISGNVFSETVDSGEVNLREAGSNGTGTIQSGALEASNVELSEQLTDMIVAQRAYQANTKVISTSDQLLEELNSLLR